MPENKQSMFAIRFKCNEVFANLFHELVAKKGSTEEVMRKALELYARVFDRVRVGWKVMVVFTRGEEIDGENITEDV